MGYAAQEINPLATPEVEGQCRVEVRVKNHPERANGADTQSSGHTPCHMLAHEQISEPGRHNRSQREDSRRRHRFGGFQPFEHGNEVEAEHAAQYDKAPWRLR